VTTPDPTVRLLVCRTFKVSGKDASLPDKQPGQRALRVQRLDKLGLARRGGDGTADPMVRRGLPYLGSISTPTSEFVDWRNRSLRNASAATSIRRWKSHLAKYPQAGAAGNDFHLVDEGMARWNARDRACPYAWAITSEKNAKGYGGQSPRRPRRGHPGPSSAPEALKQLFSQKTVATRDGRDGPSRMRSMQDCDVWSTTDHSPKPRRDWRPRRQAIVYTAQPENPGVSHIPNCQK